MKKSPFGYAAAWALLIPVLVGCNPVAGPTPQPLPTVVLGGGGGSNVPAALAGDASGKSARASGVVVPMHQAQIVSAVAGQIKAIQVSVGDVVTAGQVLAVLDDEVLRAELAGAAATLQSAQANYELLAAGPTDDQVRQAESALMSATANYSRTVTGARPAEVAAAQAALDAANDAYQKVLGGPQTEDIAAVTAGLRSAEAALKQAQAKYDDAYRRDPAAIGASPAALALEQATNAYAAAKALYDKAAKPADDAQRSAALQQVQSAKAALDRTRRPATAYDVAQAKAQVVAAQAQLDAVRSGARSQQLDAAKAQAAAAQAQVQSIEAQLRKMSLRAPIAGTVSKIALNSQDWVIPGQAIMALADLDHLRVETTDLSERDVPAVKAGQAVSVFIKALNQTAKGHLVEIAPVADTLGGDVVYKTTIDLDERPDGLRAGMSVVVQFGA